MKIIKVVDEDTLEMRDMIIEDEKDLTKIPTDDINDAFRQAITCDPDEFTKRYMEFKEAKARFDEVYEPFKLNLLSLYKDNPHIPKSVIVGGKVKLTHVAPNIRNTIDSKKLKEEEPELAKKFTKETKVSASIRLEEI